MFNHSTGKRTTTTVGHLIDVATDGATNTSENWTMFMEICDVINQTDDGPKDAAKQIRRRFATKNAVTIDYTLSLLQTCVKNCGKRFHLYVAKKDFLDDLIKVINPKNSPSLATQVMVLGMIQTWAHAFSKTPELKECGKFYQELKGKGVEFPPLDLEQASSANIPSKSTPTVAITEVPVRQGGQRTMVATIPSGGYPPAVARPPPTVQYGAMPPPQGGMQAVPGGPLPVSAERGAKLRAELSTVQQNCRVFGEMLTELSSGQPSQSDFELLEDLNMTCRQMQKRILELIQTIDQEQVTEELLTVNDELNNVFLRYDRYQRLRSGSNQAQPTAAGATPYLDSQPAGRGNLPPSYSQELPYPTHGSAMPAMNMPIYDNVISARGAPTTNQTKGPAIANLIDLDDASPPQPANRGAALYPSANIGAQFSDLNIGGGAFDNDDDFGALAQSRQAERGATGNPTAKEIRDKESDILEMQQWLIANPSSTNNGGSAGSFAFGQETTESATNLEFERFLSQRAMDAQSLPNAGTGAQPTPGHVPTKDEPLFSL